MFGGLQDGLSLEASQREVFSGESKSSGGAILSVFTENSNLTMMRGYCNSSLCQIIVNMIYRKLTGNIF